MSLSEYREIAPGAAYPHVPDDQLAGSFVIKLRFFLQGRKYGRRVLLDGETQGGGYGYEVAGEIAQHDANQVGTIVEFELTTYSRTTMPNGKPAAAAVTSWEAVIPRKSWPYRPLPADFSRHVVEALALGNPADPTSDAWRFGVDRVLTDEQHEELREALAAGTEADSGTGGRYAHCWDAVAGEDEPVPFVPVHEPKPPVGRDALAEPPWLGNVVYLGVGETTTINLPSGGTMHVAVVSDGDFQHNTVDGGDESVIMPPGDHLVIGSQEDDDEELHVVSGTTAAEAKLAWRDWLIELDAQPGESPF